MTFMFSGSSLCTSVDDSVIAYNCSPKKHRLALQLSQRVVIELTKICSNLLIILSSLEY